MKSRILVTLAIGAFASAGLPTLSAQANQTKPVIITPPAVNNGSNWSRAPFPAQRQFDDVKSPDGEAIDQTLPPNSAASNIEPPPPPARVAIFAPATVPVATVAVTAPDPVLTPTGRSTTMVATSLDATTFAPSIRSATHASRDQVLADIESRVKASESAVTAVHSAASQMSAAGRQSFDAAAADLREKAKALRKSIDKARSASANEWENARAQLAADFDAYAAAAVRLDATAR